MDTIFVFVFLDLWSKSYSIYFEVKKKNLHFHLNLSVNDFTVSIMTYLQFNK